MSNWMFIILWSTRFILVLLIFLSVWSVAVMLDRRKYFLQLNSLENAEALEAFEKQIGQFNSVQEINFIKATQLFFEKNSQKLTPYFKSFFELLFKNEKIQAHQFERLYRAWLTKEKQKMESGLSILATLGSNAPFIGLLGTVLGIIQAFGELSGASGGGQANSGAVIAGISEALVVTAIGLLVAIPAVVAYNYFGKKMKSQIQTSDRLRDLVLSQVS